jgi:predicted metallopeptidase
VNWVKAPDIKKRVIKLSKTLKLDWLDNSNLHCFRSYNSRSRAYARIWGLSKVWQQALSTKPAYIIEVISEKFDALNVKRQDEIILHEIAHIPKNYSGSLLPHIRKRGKRNFNDRVRQLIRRHRNS